MKKPVSPKRLAANRANAARSTGPRSAQGKARSAQNSRKHGFTASVFAVVRLEELDEVARLREDLIACYRPVNSQELFAIERIALAQQSLFRTCAFRFGAPIMVSVRMARCCSPSVSPSATILPNGSPDPDTFIGSDPSDTAVGNVDRLRVRQPEYHERAVYSESTAESRPPAARPNPVNWDRLPTVLRNGPYRFFFYSADRDEPAHVHIERDDASAKLWLEPVWFEGSRGFGRGEIGWRDWSPTAPSS